MGMMTVFNPMQIAPDGRGLVTHLGATAAFGLGGAAASAFAGEVVDKAIAKAGMQDGTVTKAAVSFLGRSAATATVVAGSLLVRDDVHRTALQAGALAGYVAPYVVAAWAWVASKVRNRNGATTQPVTTTQQPQGGFTPSSFGGRPDPLPALGADYLTRQQPVGADYGPRAVVIDDDDDFNL